MHEKNNSATRRRLATTEMLFYDSVPALRIEGGQVAPDAHQLDAGYAQFRDQTRFWIQRVAVPMIMVVGLFGNLITVIIMTRRRMRSTTNMYLAALAFVDMLYLILTFLLGLSHYPNVARRRYYLYWKLKPFLMMLTDSCSNTSVWLTVTFTIERFIAVRYPIKGKVWCTEARAKRLIVGVFLFAILFTFPTPFEWKVVERRVAPTLSKPPQTSANVSEMNAHDVGKMPSIMAGDTHSTLPLNISSLSEEAHQLEPEADDDDQVLMALEYSDFGSNDTYKTIYYWSTAAIFYFIPLLSLTFFNGFLIHSVHRSRRERNKMTNQRGGNSAETLVFDRDQPSIAGNGKHSVANKNSNHLKPGEKPPIVEKLMSESSGDTFPEVRFKVVGELANRDVKSDENFRSQNVERTIVNNQRTDCDKRDSNLLADLFVNASQPVTSSPKPTHQEQPTSATGIRCAPFTERSSDLKGTPDDAITRLSLLAPDNTASPRSGSLKASAREKDDRGDSNNGAPFAPVSASSRSQLASLDISLANNHSSCSSFNEIATPAHQTIAIAPASSQERRITIMLISVVILFLVCQIPTAAMLLYTSVHETIPNTNEQALQLALGNIFNFLMAVNAAGNFILYSFLSKKYRRTFVILFCSCLRGAPNKRHYHNSTRPESRRCPCKSSTTTNTISSTTDEASKGRWMNVLFLKVSRPPTSADNKRISINDNESSYNPLIKVAECKRSDTLV